MKWKLQLLLITLALCVARAFAGEPGNTASARHITLHEAVQLALQHNHNVHIAEYKVEEKQHAKEVAKSAYFPTIHNDSNFVHLTDTQLIQINAGSLGTVLGSPVPPITSIINQGGINLTTSGTQLTQPLTTLLKIRRANDMAQAELKASRQKAQQTENDVALKVHQLYYMVLIAQVHRAATEARIKASQELQSERVQQVKHGSTLEENLIESRAQLLQAKQELLTTDLQLSDLKLQLNDAMGLPLTTALDLDPNTAEVQPACAREACVAEALESHPEIIEARNEVEKANAGGSPGKRQTSMCQMWMPLLVTATKTTFHFWPVISAVSVFTSAMISSTRGASVRSFTSARLSCRRRKKILPGLPMRSSLQCRPPTTSWKKPSKCGRYPRKCWPCALSQIEFCMRNWCKERLSAPRPRWGQPRNSTPGRCFCSHSWITPRRMTRSSTPWAGHLNR